MTSSGGGREYSLGEAVLKLYADRTALDRSLGEARASAKKFGEEGVKIPVDADTTKATRALGDFQSLLGDIKNLLTEVNQTLAAGGETLERLSGMLERVGSAGNMAAGALGVLKSAGAAVVGVVHALTAGVGLAALSGFMGQLARGAGMTGVATVFEGISGALGRLGAAAQAVAGKAGIGGFAAAAALAIPVLGQIGLAAMGVQAIFGGLRAAVMTVLGPLQQLSTEASRFNKSVAESGIFASQSFGIFGEDGKAIEGTANQMKAVRGIITKEYQAIQKEVAQINGATAQEIYEGFNIIMQNVNALGEDGKDLSKVGKLSTRIAAGMNTMGVPQWQLRSEVNALMMGNIGPDAMFAKKLGLDSETVKKQQQEGTYYDFLMRKLEKLYDGQKVLALSLDNVKSNFADVSQAISSEGGQALESGLARGLKMVLDTLTATSDSFMMLMRSISELLTPILLLLGQIGAVVVSIGAAISSILSLVMELGTLALNVLGTAFLAPIQGIVRSLELVARLVELIVKTIGLGIRPFSAAFGENTRSNIERINEQFDTLMGYLDRWEKFLEPKNVASLIATSDLETAFLKAEAREKGLSGQDADDYVAKRQKEQAKSFENLLNPGNQDVTLKSTLNSAKFKQFMQQLDAEEGTGRTRALNFSKQYAKNKEDTYKNEITSLQKALELMNKQKELQQQMNALAEARRVLTMKSYDLAVQVAASPEAKAAAESNKNDMALAQEKEGIQEKRRMLETERELQRQQQAIQERQLKIQQEQLKIQMAELTMKQEETSSMRREEYLRRANLVVGSEEYKIATQILTRLDQRVMRLQEQRAIMRETVRLSFEQVGIAQEIASLGGQSLDVQQQALDTQEASANYTREQQTLLADLAAREREIVEGYKAKTIEAAKVQNSLKEAADALDQEAKRLEEINKLEAARATLTATRQKAAVQEAEILKEVTELGLKAKDGGGAASVIEAQIAELAAGSAGYRSAAEAVKALNDAKAQQLEAEQRNQREQLRIQQEREKSEIRINALRLAIQLGDAKLQGIQLQQQAAQLRLQQQRDNLAPLIPGASTVPGLPGVAVPITHRDTGAGFTIPGAKDQSGRPVVFSEAAANAFAAMVRDSGGLVKPGDVTSSQRSAAKNRAVGGAAGSEHLDGEAMDIHGRSNAWIRANGARYGWTANDYPGSHGGHFEFKGGAVPSAPTLPPVGMAGTMDRFLNFLASLESDFSNTAVSSSRARGRFQFLDSTRKDAKDRFGMDPAAFLSDDFGQQKGAVADYIRRLNPAAHAAILRGDFNSANRLLNGTWTSLPGGAEQASATRMAAARAYLGGAAAPVPGTLATTGSATVTTTANQLAEVAQAQAQNKTVIQTLTDTIKELNNNLNNLVNPRQALEQENLSEDQAMQRRQQQYDAVKSELMAEVMQSPRGQLAVGTADSLSGAVSGGLKQGLQAALSGGDAKAAVASVLQSAGQQLLDAALDSMLKPLLAQLQGSIFKAIAGVDIEELARSKSAASLWALSAAASAATAALGGQSGFQSAGALGALAPLLGGVGNFSSAFSGPSNAILGFSLPSLIPRAKGGDTSYGLAYLMGEVGPEIQLQGRSGTTISNEQLGKALRAPSSSGASEMALARLTENQQRRERSSAPQRLELSYRPEEINGVRYVTEEQLFEATQLAVAAGRDLSWDGLQNSPGLRQSLGWG